MKFISELRNQGVEALDMDSQPWPKGLLYTCIQYAYIQDSMKNTRKKLQLHS